MYAWCQRRAILRYLKKRYEIYLKVILCCLRSCAIRLVSVCLSVMKLLRIIAITIDLKLLRINPIDLKSCQSYRTSLELCTEN